VWKLRERLFGKTMKRENTSGVDDYFFVFLTALENGWHVVSF
jgi:hypothetical protein